MDLDGDDWLFESIRKYKLLSLYDLQHNITAMDWVDGTSVCVATSSGGKHEMLELALPDKLLEDESTASLKKDRDFRVQAGGFCSSAVRDLEHLPGTRLCAVTMGDNSGVGVWQLGSDSTDLIQRKEEIKAPKSSRCTVKLSVWKEGEDCDLVCGSCLNNIFRVNLGEPSTVQEYPDMTDTRDITSLTHLNRNTVAACSRNGDIFVLDLRCSKVKVRQCSCQGKPASFWTLSSMSTGDSQSERLLQLSSGGEILMLDSRWLGESVTTMKTHYKTDQESPCLSVQASSKAASQPCLSMSGFGGEVALFDAKTDSKCEDETEPFFIHKGHVSNCEDQSKPPDVTCHLWHPWKPDLVLSAATDGSLHAWQYSLDNDQT